MSYVVDASVAVKWVVTEALSEEAAALQVHTLIAPSLWLLECANVLWVKARRGELSEEEARFRYRLIRESPVQVSPIEPLADAATDLAHRLDVTPYDAAYLALSRSRHLPLVTADRKLLRRVVEGPVEGLEVVALEEV